MIGYDYVLSIEHEDSLMSAAEGLDQAVRFLNTILLKEEPGSMTWASSRYRGRSYIQSTASTALTLIRSSSK